jgi:hypothetical protein
MHLSILFHFFRVRKVTTDGRLSLVAGREAECNCLDASCPCYDPGHFLASNVHFSAISAITVTPDSVLTIADQGNYRLRSLSSGMLRFVQEIITIFLLFFPLKLF